MFFQGLIYISLLILFCFCVWHFVIKSWLESRGIQVHEAIEPEPTTYEKKRNTLEENLDTTRKDANAANFMVEMDKEKDKLEKQIAAADRKMK